MTTAETRVLKTFVVVNPRSSGGATGARWRLIAQRLDAAGFEWAHAFTERPGHATELSRQALRAGFERVVACGGDGTINEVVNGFFERGEPVAARPVLGILPSGTGGDYRKSFGMSRDPQEAIARLRSGTLRTVDCGRVVFAGPNGHAEVRYFANIASLGMSALVCKKVNESGKRLGGRLSFLTASAAALFQYRAQPVSFLTDRGMADGDEPVEQRVTMAAFCVGRYFGGGMFVAPEAALDDGLLDVVTLLTTGKDLFGMTRIYKGTHIGQRGTRHWRGRAVDVDAHGDREVYIEADGEVVGQLPARFEIVSAAYRIAG